jgi:hypothetical protein
MKKTLLLPLFLAQIVKTSAFDIAPTEIMVHHIFDSFIQENEDISILNLVSKRFYRDVWNQKRMLLLNRYLNYGIFHHNENYNISLIAQHFQSLYSPENTLLNTLQLESIKREIESKYDDKRMQKVLTYLSPQSPFFKDLMEKGDIVGSKKEILINNLPLWYKQYFCNNVCIIVTAGLKEYSLDQRKQLVFPFLQFCHQIKDITKLSLRFLTFQDIFHLINEENLHLFRHVIDPTGNPLFLSLVEHNQDTLIKLYAQKKENINITNMQGESALHHAKTPEIISLLLSLPIKPHLKSHGAGYEAFHKLCTITPFVGTRIELLSLFLKAGFNINTKTKSGKTLLHLACLLDLYDVAEATLNYHIDCNAQDINGNTALHIACQGNKVSLISLLFKSSARFDIRNNENKTAFDYIQRYQRARLEHIKVSMC